MKNIEIINCINNLDEFIKKDIPVSYKVRRAIVKNRQALIDEYKLFEEERKRLLESGKKDEELNKELNNIIYNEDIDISFIMINENDLEIEGMSVKDELILEFMIEK